MTITVKFFTLCFLMSLVCSCAIAQSSIEFDDIEEQLGIISELPTSDQPEKILQLMEEEPLFTHRIIKHLIENDVVPNTTIEIVVEEKRLSVQKVVASIEAEPVVITPLYHSASVTLNSTNKKALYLMQYKERTGSNWLTSSLDYDISSDTFTTSLLNLKEDMNYEVRIFKGSYFNNTGYYTFSTKGKPSFLAKNTYNLSDIYDGGVLDLVALDIKGDENNWVKIINDNNTIISTTDEFESAINIGSNSYIYFENITINGGGQNAVSSDKAHHIWFNGCNISNWGRESHYEKNGFFYANEDDTSPINYDSAFALTRTGVVTIENCEVHSPRSKANNWGSGHPFGANAFLVHAIHPEVEFQGQIVIRNNRFYGTDERRFNDVIESRDNGSSLGGFIRDSAIYNNYLAYANDDIIEIDGSQNNVLIYNNEIEQGFCGISALPNRQGPSYIFNNYIHNLGDDRDKAWAAIKLGGLVSRPAGKVNIFNNLINSNNNGIAYAGYSNDTTFWADVWSNVIITNDYDKDKAGYGVIENLPFDLNEYYDNFLFNTIIKGNLMKVMDNHDFVDNNYDALPRNYSDDNSSFVLIDDDEVAKANKKLINTGYKLTIGIPLTDN